MRKCERCSKKIPANRISDYCDKCGGEMYCQANGHDYMFESGAILSSPEELTFQCNMCCVEIVCLVTPLAFRNIFTKL